MASAFFGLNRGQTGNSAAAGSSPVAESATATQSTDVEVRVDLTKSLTKGEILILLEAIERHILKNQSKFLVDL